jgi:hypothetical protein
MLEFLKETFFLKRSHTIFFGLLVLFFIASHLFGFSYFNDIKTEDTKVRYNRNSSIYHK